MRGPAVHGMLRGAVGHTGSPVGVVFPGRRGAATAVAIGSAVFVAAGAWLLAMGLGLVRDAPSAWLPVWGLFLAALGVVALVLFGCSGAVAMWSAVGPRPGLAVLPEGVYARAPTGTAWVRWDDIARAAVVGQGGSGAYVALAATSHDAIVLGGLNRWLRGVNRRRYDMDVGYPGNQLRLGPETAVDVIRYHWGDPSARSRLADPDAVDIEAIRDLGRPPGTFDLSREAAGWQPTHAPLRQQERADGYLRRAAAAGHAPGATELGLLLEQTGRAAEAEAYYRDAVDAGGIATMTYLGLLCVRTDRAAEAETWWRAAAEAGDEAAMCELGIFLVADRRVVEGEMWLRRAAERADPIAMWSLVQLYRDTGREPEAAAWERRAADRGH